MPCSGLTDPMLDTASCATNIEFAGSHATGYSAAVVERTLGGSGLFGLAGSQAPLLARSAAGLVLPGIPATASMLGLAPVAEPSAWMANMVRTYLIAREYLEPAESSRGREFSRENWITALLALHPRDEYIYQLAALNHAACHKELTEEYQARFLAQIPPGDAAAVRSALAGGVDGAPRAFLARQIVLRAMRLVLVPPDPPKAPDPAVAATLAGVGPETAAVLLVHLAADALAQERPAGEPQLGLTSLSLAMEMVANSLFNERDDVGDMLARYRLLWINHGSKLIRDPARLNTGRAPARGDGARLR